MTGTRAWPDRGVRVVAAGNPAKRARARACVGVGVGVGVGADVGADVGAGDVVSAHVVEEPRRL